MINLNGPVNYCCLEGNFNGVKKKITLFMDIHKKLDEQTRCNTFDSIDISHYMYKNIKNTNTKLDFFLEIDLDELKSKQTNKRDIYIKEIFELFKSEFVIEKMNNKDIVRYYKSNENVRLHYLDIRNAMDINSIRFIFKNKINKIFNLLYTSKNKTDNIRTSQKILIYLEQIKTKINKLLRDKDDVKNNNLENISNDKQKFYLHKIINRCNDDKLKNNLIKFIDDNCYKISNDLNRGFLDIERELDEIKYTNDVSNIEKLNYIYQIINFIEEASLDLYSLFVDCYLLRRVLDKNYITNSIIYTGIQHSIHYIFFLVKFYDFKINKIFHLEKNINDMIKSIKNTNFVIDIYSWIIDNKKTYPQCIKYDNLFLGGVNTKFYFDKISI
jgi:hypothetical protein